MAFDPAAYHPKWPLIRRLVLRRAQHRCEWCQARHRRPHPRTGSRVYLAVAHVDRDRSHNRFHNLAALCQRCHLNHDRPQHHLSKIAGTDWQKKQLVLALAPDPLLLAYRAGLVQLIPFQRQRAQQETAAGRLTPRSQFRLTYQPLLVVSLPALSRAEATERRISAIHARMASL